MWCVQRHLCIAVTTTAFVLSAADGAQNPSTDVSLAASTSGTPVTCADNPCQHGTCSKVVGGQCNGEQALAPYGGQYCCTCAIGWAGQMCEIQALFAVSLSSNMVCVYLLCVCRHQPYNRFSTFPHNVMSYSTHKNRYNLACAHIQSRNAVQ